MRGHLSERDVPNHADDLAPDRVVQTAVLHHAIGTTTLVLVLFRALPREVAVRFVFIRHMIVAAVPSRTSEVEVTHRVDCQTRLREQVL